MRVRSTPSFANVPRKLARGLKSVGVHHHHRCGAIAAIAAIRLTHSDSWLRMLITDDRVSAELLCKFIRVDDAVAIHAEHT